MQILLVLAILLDKGVTALPEPILTGLIGGAALTTVSSGGFYVWEWGRRALSRKTGERPVNPGFSIIGSALVTIPALDA
ncbi:MAG: hypothetical protein R3F37_22755 [Candidatus Competibacteraceae bacterium]